jgi:3-hydroxyisobutyrate dehydrogenase
MRFSLRTLSQPLERAKSISFIGLGRMGSEMAFNLFSKTHTASPDAQLVVCDAVPDAAAAFCDNFARHFPGANVGVAANPAEAVAASRTVLTMLPSSPQVRAVYSEAGGMLQTLRTMDAPEAQATLFVDSTTLDVGVGRAVAAEAREAGAEMIDAPVSGGTYYLFYYIVPRPARS